MLVLLFINFIAIIIIINKLQIFQTTTNSLATGLTAFAANVVFRESFFQIILNHTLFSFMLGLLQV